MRERKQRKREKQKEKERKRDKQRKKSKGEKRAKQREKDVQDQLLSICIQFLKRKKKNIGRNAQNFKKLPTDT